MEKGDFFEEFFETSKDELKMPVSDVRTFYLKIFIN